METGHSGASGRFEALKEVAMEYAFLIGLEKIFSNPKLLKSPINQEINL